MKGWKEDIIGTCWERTRCNTNNVRQNRLQGKKARDSDKSY